MPLLQLSDLALFERYERSHHIMHGLNCHSVLNRSTGRYGVWSGMTGNRTAGIPLRLPEHTWNVPRVDLIDRLQNAFEHTVE